MDNIVIGESTDPNYKRIGLLADGTPVYRYDPLPADKVLVDEAVIKQYNKSVELVDTKTQKLLDKFKWDDLKELEKANLKERLNNSYVEVFTKTPIQLQPKDKSKWNESTETVDTDTSEYTDGLKKVEPVQKKVTTPKPKKKTKKVSKK